MSFARLRITFETPLMTTPMLTSGKGTDRQISPRDLVYTETCSKIIPHLIFKVDYLNYIKSLVVVIHLEGS